jgi:hypothetical protein
MSQPATQTGRNASERAMSVWSIESLSKKTRGARPWALLNTEIRMQREDACDFEEQLPLITYCEFPPMAVIAYDHVRPGPDQGTLSFR